MRNTVVVAGVGDLRDALGMVLLDGWRLDPPEVRTRLVEVPGRSGSLDLTEAVSGTPLYGDRHQEMTFLVRDRDRAAARERVVGALHGRRLRYSLSFDPGHDYVGRWAVGEVGWAAPDASTFAVAVTAEPWRYRPTRTYRLNPVGGRWYDLECGDMPVRPTLECSTPTWVQDASGRVTRVPAGTWRLNDVLLTRGLNRLYVSSWTVRDTRWGYVGPSGRHPLRWGDARGMAWGELSRLAGADAAAEGMAVRAWGDTFGMKWGELRGRKWGELRLRPTDEGGNELPVDATVYISYEWGDL